MGKRISIRNVRRQQVEEQDGVAPAWRSRFFSYNELSPHYRAKIVAYRAFALRTLDGMHLRINGGDEADRFLDFVRFAFARYRVPTHLERCWLFDVPDDFIDDPRPRAQRSAPPAGHVRPDLIRWYIIVAQGGSLYREAARPYLSRLETHHFLNAPIRPALAHRMLWYAVARAATDESINAARVSLT